MSRQERRKAERAKETLGGMDEEGFLRIIEEAKETLMRKNAGKPCILCDAPGDLVGITNVLPPSMKETIEKPVVQPDGRIGVGGLIGYSLCTRCSTLPNCAELVEDQIDKLPPAPDSARTSIPIDDLL